VTIQLSLINSGRLARLDDALLFRPVCRKTSGVEVVHDRPTTDVVAEDFDGLVLPGDRNSNTNRGGLVAPSETIPTADLKASVRASGETGAVRAKDRWGRHQDISYKPNGLSAILRSRYSANCFSVDQGDGHLVPKPPKDRLESHDIQPGEGRSHCDVNQKQGIRNMTPITDRIQMMAASFRYCSESLPKMFATQPSASSASMSVPQRTISSMSSQSLGRS